ncbi:MAG: hypothetical protein LH632_09245 [Rhodoferax sp.]|nr:hypothetical protein [Rhodoferax sp.]
MELTRNHIERDATGCVRAPHAPGLGIIMITEQAARRYQIDTELRVSCRSL